MTTATVAIRSWTQRTTERRQRIEVRSLIQRGEQEALPDSCTESGCENGYLIPGVRTLDYSESAHTIRVTVRGVPVKICPQCGQVYLLGAAHTQLEDLAAQMISVLDT